MPPKIPMDFIELKRTEFFAKVQNWTYSEILDLFIKSFLSGGDDKIMIEAVNAIISNEDINITLEKMGRQERIGKQKL